MLERKYHAVFAALLKGDVLAANLSDEQAKAIANAMAGEAVTGPRAYLTAALDSMDKGLDAGPEISGDERANVEFGSENAKGNSVRNAVMRRVSETNRIPPDWRSVTAFIEDLVGNSYRLKPLILMEYEGAPDRYDCLRSVGKRTIYISPKYENWLQEL